VSKQDLSRALVSGSKQPTNFIVTIKVISSPTALPDLCPQKSRSLLPASSMRSASGLPPQVCPASASPLLCSCAAPPHQSQRAPSASSTCARQVGLLRVRALLVDSLLVKPTVSLLISLCMRATGRRHPRQARRRPPYPPPQARCRRSTIHWMEPHCERIRGGERTRTEGGVAAHPVFCDRHCGVCWAETVLLDAVKSTYGE
jgi:hypothetical protein